MSLYYSDFARLVILILPLGADRGRETAGYPGHYVEAGHREVAAGQDAGNREGAGC